MKVGIQRMESLGAFHPNRINLEAMGIPIFCFKIMSNSLKITYKYRVKLTFLSRQQTSSCHMSFQRKLHQHSTYPWRHHTFGTRRISRVDDIKVSRSLCHCTIEICNKKLRLTPGVYGFETLRALRLNPKSVNFAAYLLSAFRTTKIFAGFRSRCHTFRK